MLIAPAILRYGRSSGGALCVYCCARCLQFRGYPKNSQWLQAPHTGFGE